MKSFRCLLAIVLVGVLYCDAPAAGPQPGGQVIATADEFVIVPASATQRIMIHSVVVLATSTTSVNWYLYNGDNELLGGSSQTLTVDLDGIDGPAGFVMPYNQNGWFQTDTVNEPIRISLSASTPVIVIVNYALLF